MYQSHVVGKIGEEIAVKYLEDIGYEIIQRNYSCKLGEIDVIAKYKDELIIIEVKTRTSNLYGLPAEAVNDIKQKHIFKVAQYYLIKNKIEDTFVRIDVIEVYLNKNKTYKLNHIKQAF